MFLPELPSVFKVRREALFLLGKEKARELPSQVPVAVFTERGRGLETDDRAKVTVTSPDSSLLYATPN